jgi:hypothetical protein
VEAGFKAWKQHNLPVYDSNLGLNYALNKGWIRKDTRGESWLFTQLGYKMLSGKCTKPLATGMAYKLRNAGPSLQAR